MAASGASDDEERVPASDPKEWLEALIPTVGLTSQLLVGTVSGSTSTESTFFNPATPAAFISPRRFDFSAFPSATLEDAPEKRDQDNQFRAPSSGDDVVLAPLAAIELSLMSPELALDYGRPRFFIHGEIPINLGPTKLISVEGDPGTLAAPEAQTNANDVPELAYSGQGSDLELRFRRAAYSAGFGMSFAFDPFGREVRLKPSIEWMRNEYKFVGKTQRAFKPYPEVDTYTEFLAIRAVGELTTNSIGPGLEIEVVTGRIGPFATSVFFGGKALRIIGDREIRFSSSISGGECVDQCKGLDPSDPRAEPTTIRQPPPAQFEIAPPGMRTASDPTGGFFGNGFLTPANAANPDPLLFTDLAPITATGNFQAKVHSWQYQIGIGIRFDFDPLGDD